MRSYRLVEHNKRRLAPAGATPRWNFASGRVLGEEPSRASASYARSAAHEPETEEGHQDQHRDQPNDGTEAASLDGGNHERRGTAIVMNCPIGFFVPPVSTIAKRQTKALLPKGS